MQLSKEIFKSKKVLIVGDVMIDQYMMGTVYRNSPEADIPVLEDVKINAEPGGAANVAINIKNLKAQAEIISVTGDDTESETLKSKLVEQGIKTHFLKDPGRKTTVKTRVFRDNQQLIRVDREDKKPLEDQINKLFLDEIEFLLNSEEFDIMILQDYNKGVLHKKNISTIINLARAKNLFIAVDPKFENFNQFQNVDLFKPNLVELLSGYGAEESFSNIEQIRDIASDVRKSLNSVHLLVTLSEKGALLLNSKNSTHLPAEKVEIVDVCGAGDAVIAISSLALESGMSPNDTLRLCIQTGKIVCSKTGVAGASIEELLTL